MAQKSSGVGDVKVKMWKTSKKSRRKTGGAGERKTRGAAQGCAETFGAAVPDTGGWLCVHPGVETFWSRIEVWVVYSRNRELPKLDLEPFPANWSRVAITSSRSSPDFPRKSCCHHQTIQRTEEKLPSIAEQKETKFQSQKHYFMKSKVLAQFVPGSLNTPKTSYSNDGCVFDENFRLDSEAAMSWGKYRSQTRVWLWWSSS